MEQVFGNPGDFQMIDPDNDDVYTITVKQPKGFTSNYIFTNGNCPTFTCKESLFGQLCADTANFNDRLLPPVFSDTTLSTCFGICSSTTSLCANRTVDVTFRVDMSQQTVGPQGVKLGASFDAWSGSIVMAAAGNGIYEVTRALVPGSYQFKYINGTNWEVLDPNDVSCTATSGPNTNRIIQVGATPITLTASCFGVCAECPPTYDVTFSN